MLVDGMEAGQHVGEGIGPDGHHEREADGGVERVAAAHPVPEAEHVGRIDAELGHRFSVGGDGHEVTGHGFVPASQPVEQPLPCGRGVGQRLQGGERLRADDEQGLGRIQVVRLPVQVDRVDVGHEPAFDVRRGVVEHRLVGHGRTQVGAPDADVDHGGDPLAGVALPVAGADGGGHLAHPVEHLVHVGHHVAAVDFEALRPRHPQGHMEHRPVLGGVDVPAGEHGVPALLDAGRAGHVHQRGQRLVIHPLFGEVEIEVAGRHRHPGATIRILGEQLPQVTMAEPFEAVREPPPLIGGRHVDDLVLFCIAHVFPFTWIVRRPFDLS